MFAYSNLLCWQYMPELCWTELKSFCVCCMFLCRSKMHQIWTANDTWFLVNDDWFQIVRHIKHQNTWKNSGQVIYGLFLFTLWLSMFVSKKRTNRHHLILFLLCYWENEGEKIEERFVTWVNDRIFLLGWTNPSPAVLLTIFFIYIYFKCNM